MLDDRKSAILRAVVQQYIETAQPVGSSTVAAEAEVAVSSATVRNDMTQLESDGYLIQPHTSAGRIPTEKGYRYFVDDLSGPGRLSQVHARQVREFFATTHGELEQMLSETSRLLSDVTGSAAVVVGDPAEVATVRSVQLVDLTPRAVLAVMVMSNGAIVKRTVELAEDVDADALEAAQRLLIDGVGGGSVHGLDDWTPDPAAPGAAAGGRGVGCTARRRCGRGAPGVRRWTVPARRVLRRP